MTTQQRLGECCVSGHIHSGRPEGLTTRIAGLDAYEAIPPTKSKAKTIIFITDIFGYTLPNARLLADEFAKAGFYVIMPDLLQGDPIAFDMLETIVPRHPDQVTLVQKATNAASTAATFGPWLVKHREAVTRPLLDGVVKALHNDPDVVKVGAIGFCWGGRYAALLAGDENLVVDAIVINHPSLLVIPGEVEALRKPTQVNIGDIDAMTDVKGVKTMQEVLAKKHDVPSEVNVFPGAVHGFTVRGDMESPEERDRKEQATQNAIDWFKKYLQ